MSLDLNQIGLNQYSVSLHVLQAWMVSLSCRQSFAAPFAAIYVDGKIKANGLAKTNAMVRALNVQLAAGTSNTYISPHIWSFAVSTLGTDINALVKRCRTVEPTPPDPEPTPDPEEPTHEPGPEPTPTPPPVESEGVSTNVVVNLANGVSDQAVASWTAAINRQLAQAAPHWGKSTVYFADRNTAVNPKHWLHTVEDVSDISGAAGYHSVRHIGGDDYEPYSVTGLDNWSPSTVLSHELLECLGNPMVNNWVSIGGTRFYWHELCDPVQSQSYKIDGVDVSNFILPAWRGDSGETQYDWMGKLTRPFEIASGGYMGRLDAATNKIDYVFAASDTATKYGFFQSFGCSARVLRASNRDTVVEEPWITMATRALS